MFFLWISFVSGIEIKSVSPTNVSAGVRVVFVAVVQGNVSSYEWDFGDGEKKATNKNFVEHIYNKVKNYNLVLNASNDSASDLRNFSIAVNSAGGIDGLILEKRDDLNNTIKDVDNFPEWQRDALREIINPEFYENELDRLDEESKDANSTELFELIKEVRALDVPQSVFISKIINSVLITDLDDINPDIIASVDGGSVGDLKEEYKNAILLWQSKNIEGSFIRYEVSAVKNRSMEIVMGIYEINVNSNFDEQSYFVVNDKNLVFKNTEKVRIEGDYSLITLAGKESRGLDFYIGGEKDLVFFASPDLDFFDLGLEIGVCNFNGICEKSNGENSDNCRNDCKPFGMAILYSVLAIVGVLVIYTLVQLWYMFRYEKHLFKDRRFLFNVLSFIENARARDKSEMEILNMLKGQGWSKEQIIYALKKSRGERTGMAEIVPISKILAYFRNKRAERNIVTGNAQQKLQNINKPLM